MPTNIEWVINPDGTPGETWNPVIGCTPISEGCANCYAKRMHERFSKEPFSKIVLHPERLDMPLKWKKPRMIFVCSMSDLFHDDVPFEFIEKVWDTMFDCSFNCMNIAKTPYYHTFIILTKRPDRMAEFYKWMDRCNRNANFGNIWLGTTVEHPDYLWRVEHLLQIPAAKHFVSFEPLLSEIIVPPELMKRLGWSIVGGESGPNARPCHPDWVRNLRNQCVSAGVPIFIKQLHINGKLIKNVKLFPEDLKIQEMPERC